MKEERGQGRAAGAERSPSNGWQGDLLGRIGDVVDEGRGVHLVVLAGPYLSLLMEGRKTVESRFSATRRAPWGCVRSGDLLLLKWASGPVVGVVEAGRVWGYEIGKSRTVEEIRGEFDGRVCGTAAFWARCGRARYATLVEVVRVRAVQPVRCAKRDQRGWVVLLRRGA